MPSNAVILFAGDARREEAEKGLPPRFLAHLHNELAALIQTVEGVDLYLATDRAGSFVLDGPRFTSRSAQCSLGAKVEEAISSCFAAGYERVAVVAGDVPGLTRELLIEALGQTRPSIGRSPDGGFYLAAFSAPPRVIWAALPWSRPDVHDALFAQLDDPHTLPALRDIDSLGDAHLATAAVADLRVRTLLRSLLAYGTPRFASFATTPRQVPREIDRPRPPPDA